MADNKQREVLKMVRSDIATELEWVTEYLRSISKGETVNVPPEIKQKVDALIAKHSK